MSENETAPVAAEAGWRDAIADQKLRAKAEKFTSPAELVKSYAELEGRLGRSVIMPGPEADSAETDAFWQRLGRPDSPAGYEFPLPEGVESASPADLAFQQAMAGVFHQAGLSAAQAKALNAGWNEYVAGLAPEAEKAALRSREAGVAQLKKEWGGDYDANLGYALRAAESFGDAAFREWCDESGVGNDPRFIRVFAAIGRRMGEESLPAGAAPTGQQGGEARLKELYGLMYTDRQKYLSDAVQGEIRKINSRLHGDGPVERLTPRRAV